MPRPSSERARVLFDAVVAQPPHLRDVFLHNACVDDNKLLAEVSELLTESLSDSSSESTRTAQDQTEPGPQQERPAAKRGYPTSVFQGTKRFVLQRRIGSGGFGIVYEARDLQKNTTVALKTLQHVTSESLYRFKREFRSLADISHPNLVRLYELSSDSDHWFFTMELVVGKHFLDYVCPPSANDRQTVDLGAHYPQWREENHGLLIPTLIQLVDGLNALHLSGHLHRDVKPSNILVTGDGRVVILDFGLAVDIADERSVQTLSIAGTPAYMSPEQAASLPLTPASDWYSLGVILYQALTGVVPFTGTYLQILTDKQRIDPPPPRSKVPGVPQQLDALCQALLRRNPADRPSADSILAAIQAPRPFEHVRGHSRAAESPHPFIGREAQRHALGDALGRVLEGTPTTVTVSGPSGIGKTSLVKVFLDDVRRTHQNAVMLTGRCYERESVPYKALDSLIDTLARYLRSLPHQEIRALLPRDAAAISRLFRVLRDLTDRVAPRLSEPVDSQEMRRRACAALRELLARVADTHPLIVFIDDLQWGDADSAGVLADVLRGPDAPALLLVIAYRDVELGSSPFLRRFLSPDVLATRGALHLSIGPFSFQESQALAGALVAPRGIEAPDIIASIAKESGGIPFFIDELVEVAQASDTEVPRGWLEESLDTDAREATLAQMIQIRVSRLSAEAQRLLRLVVVNARPLPERVLRFAADVDSSDDALMTLRSERIVRARDSGEGIEFEAYHDRIREIIAATLDATTTMECHRRLAFAFEQEEAFDSELVAGHFAGAGDRARAAHYMEAAAAAADRALAFDRAAGLYRTTLELLDPISERRLGVRSALGQALANAGRSAEAADVFLTIATESSTSDALSPQLRAAQQLLFGGHISKGLTVLRTVLRAVGMRFPETRTETLSALLVGRLRARLRGIAFRERSAQDVPPNQLAKIDVCWSVSAGLSVVDTMRGAVFETRHLVLALRAGEIERVYRALCLEAAFIATRGRRNEHRVRRIQALAKGLSVRIATPYAEALYEMACGSVEYLTGRWKVASASLTRAERLMVEHCTGVTWELDSTRLFAMWSQYQLGELKAMTTRFDPLLKDAAERDDLFVSTALRGLYAHLVYLAKDDADVAAAHTREAIEQWRYGGFQMPQLWHLWSSAEIDLYRQRGTAAWQRVEQTWSSLDRSLLMRAQVMSVYMLDLRARAALAAAGETVDARTSALCLQTAIRSARKLEQLRTGWADGLASLIRAGVQYRHGHHEDTVAALRGAEESLLAADMRLLAAVAQRKRGELIGGAEGAHLRDAGEEWMLTQDIRKPAAFARIFVPW